MNPREKYLAVVQAVLNIAREFQMQGTPGGDEYARRAALAVRALLKKDITGAKRWANLCSIA